MSKYKTQDQCAMALILEMGRGMADLLMIVGGGQVSDEDRHRRARRIEELCDELLSWEEKNGG